MKSLFFGIVLIVLVGVAGFFYRNVMEHEPIPEPVACTMDAKMCPDGSAVGRTAPSCAFARCPFPNLEDEEIDLGLVIPAGYEVNEEAVEGDSELRIVLDKQGAGSIPHNIVVRRFMIEEAETAEDVMIAQTLFETSGIQAESMDEFDVVILEGRTFYRVTVERFEAQIHTLYYLPREKDVLRFEVLERDVVQWMEPELVIEELPEHRALLQVLESLQLGA